MEAVLNDEHAETRRWSAWALGEIEDIRAETALIAAAKDENAEVRRWALWALGELEDGSRSRSRSRTRKP
jgi:HEAT repeat protein